MGLTTSSPALPEPEKLELLVEASSRLLGQLSLPDVLSSILEIAARMIPVEAHSIWRRQEDGWHPVVSQGLSQRYLEEEFPPATRNIVPEPIVCNDVQLHPSLEWRRHAYEAEGIHALLVMPLTIQGKLAGTLVFYSRTSHGFSTGDVKLASAFANLAGAAITSAELYEEQLRLVREKERAQKRADFLAQASQILASSLDYETTLAAVARLSAASIADWCMVDVADPNQELPRRLATVHRDPKRLAFAKEFQRRYPADSSGAVARVIRTGESILTPEISDADLAGAARDAEHLRLLRELGAVSFMCVPMKARGRTLGALSLLSATAGRNFNAGDLAFAQDLVDRCALAIDNALFYREAAESAERERESRTEVEVLNRIGQLLAAELNVERLLQAVTDAAREVTGAKFGAFFYDAMNDKGEAYTLYTRSGVPPEAFSAFTVRGAAELFDPTLRGQRVIRIGNLRSDARLRENEAYRALPLGNLPVASYLAAPIIARSGNVIGGLFLGHPDEDVFTERHERIIAGLTAETAIAMDNALLLDSVQKAKKEISDANEQLSNVLESTRDVFVAIDNQWLITHLNERAANMMGRDRNSLLRTDVRDLLVRGIGHRVLTQLKKALQDRQAVQFEEYLRHSDVWLEISAYPTRFGLAVFGRDVTERKRFEERLHRAEKLESLGVLAGGVAHDFNNLLVGILGNASVVMDMMPESSPEWPLLQNVVNASEKAARLTRQLLAYAGKGRFVIEIFDLSRLVSETTDTLHGVIPRSIRLLLELGEDLPCVEGDVSQIQSVVMNLVINAAEAIGENSPGEVVVRTGRKTLDERDIHQNFLKDEISAGEYVTLEVKDTGCGMDETTLARMFDPFFTTKSTGRGLGASAVQGIVRGHRGALRVESVVGQGSTFRLYFPASTGEQPRQVEKKPEQQSARGKGVILIVDDEEMVRTVAKNALGREGFEVIVAENGKEGVDIFGALAHRISLVVLDLTMPGMGGEEALERIRAIRPDANVVLSSGYDETEAIGRFHGNGLAAFLQKPYTAAHLTETVRKCLMS